MSIAEAPQVNMDDFMRDEAAAMGTIPAGSLEYGGHGGSKLLLLVTQTCLYLFDFVDL